MAFGQRRFGHGRADGKHVLCPGQFTCKTDAHTALGVPSEEGDALEIPVLVPGDRPVAEWLKPVAGEPLRFRTASIARPGDVALLPFYEMHHRRYIVYWDVEDAEGSQ